MTGKITRCKAVQCKSAAEYAAVESKAFDKKTRAKFNGKKFESYQLHIYFFISTSGSGLKLVCNGDGLENFQCEILMNDENVLVLASANEKRLKLALKQKILPCVRVQNKVGQRDFSCIDVTGRSREFINYVYNVCSYQGNINNHLEGVNVWLKKQKQTI